MKPRPSKPETGGGPCDEKSSRLPRKTKDEGMNGPDPRPV
jgi:hypothetical protein